MITKSEITAQIDVIMESLDVAYSQARALAKALRKDGNVILEDIAGDLDLDRLIRDLDRAGQFTQDAEQLYLPEHFERMALESSK